MLLLPEQQPKQNKHERALAACSTKKIFGVLEDHTLEKGDELRDFRS
jgi:hypothetical protein